MKETSNLIFLSKNKGSLSNVGVFIQLNTFFKGQPGIPAVLFFTYVTTGFGCENVLPFAFRNKFSSAL